MANIYFDFFEFENLILQIGTDDHYLKSIKFVNLVPASYIPNEANPPILLKTKQQLKAYFEGELQVFDLDLDPDGTAFQKKVWELLVKIPYGKTETYASMAHQLGDPKVIRAAATANGKNPIAIVIPCHRVIGTNGSLTGYAGGLSNKKLLLDLENRIKNGVLEIF